jgi:formamidopyrimidine-DNA glycosylase
VPAGTTVGRWPVPELPEVETIRHDLDREVTGRRIKSVEVIGTRSVRRGTKKAFITRLEGAKITGAKRRGKYLVLTLDTKEWLVVHLRMSGQLLLAAAKDPKPKHTHVVITFQQGGQLRFVDPRTFGEMFVVHPDQIPDEAPELGQFGFDPVDDPISWITFGHLLLARRMLLKSFLTDQGIVAGIGNIYSDEILHAAGLRYDRPSGSLSPQEMRRLYRSVIEVLAEAIKARGSSLADDQYVDLHGRPGGYQTHHQVYAREGKPCHRCRATIEKAKWQGRSTYYCPQCQV